MSRFRGLSTSLTALLVLGAAAGCSESPGSSGDQGFVSAGGTITTLPVEERRAPAEVSGETLEGDELSLDDFAGEVVVVNVWGSWCAPCRSEAPMLADAARDFADDGVQFVGINTRNATTAEPLAFERSFDVPYPSLFDPSGRTLLSFRETLPLNAIPSTVIIDREGRVAGRVLGEIRSETSFRDLVEEIVAEDEGA